MCPRTGGDTQGLTLVFPPFDRRLHMAPLAAIKNKIKKTKNPQTIIPSSYMMTTVVIVGRHGLKVFCLQT
jgi:hypothetical protein